MTDEFKMKARTRKRQEKSQHGAFCFWLAEEAAIILANHRTKAIKLTKRTADEKGGKTCGGKQLVLVVTVIAWEVKASIASNTERSTTIKFSAALNDMF